MLSFGAWNILAASWAWSPQEIPPPPPPPGSSLLTLFFSGLVPHLLGDVVFLWGCNLLAHFINAYLVDDSVSDSPGGLGNDQNPGSQVCWNKDLFFLCTSDAQGLGQTQGLWGSERQAPRAREGFWGEV